MSDPRTAGESRRTGGSGELASQKGTDPSAPGKAPKTPIRKKWGWRRVHKWLAIVAGVFLTLWIISGLVLAIPGGGAPEFRQLGPVADVRAAFVSPAEAVLAVEASGAPTEEIGAVTLIFLGTRPAYRVRVRAQEPVLIDARTAERIEIDAAEALRLVRDYYGGSGTPEEPELVNRYDWRYFWGELPAYRIAFNDEYGTVADVSVRSGTITWWDGRSRMRRWMAAAHDWWPLARLSSQRTRLWIFWLTGALSLAATLTGYWLALRRTRRRRR